MLVDACNKWLVNRASRVFRLQVGGELGGTVGTEEQQQGELPIGETSSDMNASQPIGRLR